MDLNHENFIISKSFVFVVKSSSTRKTFMCLICLSLHFNSLSQFISIEYMVLGGIY